MDDLTWIPVVSSMISRIAYDAQTEELYVEFTRGTVWAYATHVENFNAMRDSDSVGRFFHSEIRTLGGRQVTA